ncbi:hypothetical protein A0H81_03567 [Grifola frondosa]|uniref:Secreted protein n=1 Tax=Grifola frondosa TaxID=5627 RepID=A0A1C7MJJ6_GRIFR|nr:hypothetical protein A0H81_03567 [Grifola frondosa]
MPPAFFGVWLSLGFVTHAGFSDLVRGPFSDFWFWFFLSRATSVLGGPGDVRILPPKSAGAPRSYGLWTALFAVFFHATSEERVVNGRVGHIM